MRYFFRYTYREKIVYNYNEKKKFKIKIRIKIKFKVRFLQFSGYEFIIAKLC